MAVAGYAEAELFNSRNYDGGYRQNIGSYYNPMALSPNNWVSFHNYLLWYNLDSGEVFAWFINGTSATATASYGGSGADGGMGPDRFG